MSNSSSQCQVSKPIRKYQKIDKEQRKIVLKMLLEDKMPIQEVFKILIPSLSHIEYILLFFKLYYQVATRLGLKYCTVRTIQRAFEKEGRIGKKETRKQKVRVESVVQISILNPFNLMLSPHFKSAKEGQIYIDRHPSIFENSAVSLQQQSLITSQMHDLYQSIINEINGYNTNQNIFMYKVNMMMAVQLLNKQLQNIISTKIEQDATTPTQLQQIK